MQKLSETDKRNIVAARQAGTKVTELAKQYGVDKSSIYNVLKAWERSGESAFTSSETEKEPVTAATDTSSEQNIIPDNSTDIVTENPENVKPLEGNIDPAPKRVPEIVKEACREKLQELYDKISQEEQYLRTLYEDLQELNLYIEEFRGDRDEI